jgi:hypothetical protein
MRMDAADRPARRTFLNIISLPVGFGSQAAATPPSLAEPNKVIISKTDKKFK